MDPIDSNITQNENLDEKVPKKPKIDNLKPKVRKEEELLYLANSEATCLESCAKAYIRSNMTMLDTLKNSLTL